MLSAQSCDNCVNRDCFTECTETGFFSDQGPDYTICRQYVNNGRPLPPRVILLINPIDCPATESWEYTFDPANNPCGTLNPGASYDQNTGAVSGLIPGATYQVCVTLNVIPIVPGDPFCSILDVCMQRDCVEEFECPCEFDPPFFGPSTGIGFDPYPGLPGSNGFDEQPNNILEVCCLEDEYANACGGIYDRFAKIWFFNPDTDMFFSMLPGTCEPILEFPAPSCVNTETGETHQISNVCGMDISAFDNNELWCVEDRPDPLPDLLFSIDLSTGMIIEGCLPLTGTCPNIQDIAINPLTGTIWGISGGDNCANQLIVIDESSGAAFLVGNLQQNGTQLDVVIDYFTFDANEELIMQLENDETYFVSTSGFSGDVELLSCPDFFSCCNNCLNAGCTHEQMTETDWGNGLSTDGIEDFDMGADEDCNFFMGSQNDNLLTVCTEFIANGDEKLLGVGSSGEGCVSPTYTYELTQDADGTGNACGVINTGAYNGTTGEIIADLEAGTTYQYCVTVDYSSDPTCNIDIICPVIIFCDDAPNCCRANAGSFPTNLPSNN